MTASESVALIPLPRTVAVPPSFSAQLTEVGRAYQQAVNYEGMAVTSDTSYQEAGAALTFVMGVMDALDALVKGLTAPYYAEWKAGNEHKKPLADRLAKIKSSLNSQMTAWEKAKEEAAKKEEEDLMPWEEPSQVVSTTPVIAGQVKKRGPIKIEITDDRAAVEWAIEDHQDMLCLNERRLKAFVSRTDGLVSIPGVRVYRDTIRARSGK